MKLGRLGVLAAAFVLMAAAFGPAAAPAAADPEAPPVDPAAAVTAPVDPAAAAPPPDAKIESLPPATTTSPDGWQLTVGAKDETFVATAPLTTALSSRDYVTAACSTGR